MKNLRHDRKSWKSRVATRKPWGNPTVKMFWSEFVDSKKENNVPDISEEEREIFDKEISMFVMGY